MQSEVTISEKLRRALRLASKPERLEYHVMVGTPTDAQIWIEGYSDMFLEVLGEAATRVLSDRAFETVVKSWIQTLDKDHRSKLETATNPIKALRFFIEASQRTGLLRQLESIELGERPDGVCMRIRGCPSIRRCGGVAGARKDLRCLSCHIFGCSGALLSSLTGRVHQYTLESVDAENGACEGVLVAK